MNLWALFWGFLKVGLLSFGGAYAAIPLIRETVLAYGWLDEAGIAAVIALSESTPGPIMVNMATYVGGVQAGVAGAAVATFAVVLPAFVLILLLTALLTAAVKHPAVQGVMGGLRPTVAGIVLATGVTVLAEALASGDGRTVMLALVLAGVYFGLGKRAPSPVGLIGIAALLGIFLNV